MTWYKFPKMMITLSVEADDEAAAIAALDSGRWEANQPAGFELEIDVEAEPYEGPELDPDA